MLEKTQAPAQLHYGEGQFDILAPGSYVVCAVTGRNIPLDRLRYWSVDRQEAYVDADASLKAEMAARGEG